MTAKVINLSSLDEDDEGFTSFLDELKNNNANAVFILERNDGEVFVGSNYSDRRDLVYAIWQLQGLAQSIVNGDAD